MVEGMNNVILCGILKQTAGQIIYSPTLRLGCNVGLVSLWKLHRGIPMQTETVEFPRGP